MKTITQSQKLQDFLDEQNKRDFGHYTKLVEKFNTLENTVKENGVVELNNEEQVTVTMKKAVGSMHDKIITICTKVEHIETTIEPLTDLRRVVNLIKKYKWVVVILSFIFGGRFFIQGGKYFYHLIKGLLP